MPVHCCVPLCNQRGVLDDNGSKASMRVYFVSYLLRLLRAPYVAFIVLQVSFFCFPKDPHLKKKWIVAIKRDEGKLFVVTKHTKVCSNLFTADSYLPNVVGDRRYLRVDAVPSVFAFGKPKPPARKKPKDRQQCVAKRKLLSAVGQASSSGFTSQPLLSPSSDVAASRDSSTAVETMDATECEASASTPACVTHVRDHEVCDCACAVRVSELEKQLSVLQMRIHQLESDLEGSTEEVKSAKANAVRVPELETQLSLLQVCIQQLESDLEIRTKEVGQMDLWLSRDKVDKAMPAIFKERYPSTRAIIDATEVRCEVPSSLVLQSATYSTYKSTNTMKGLVVISPDGTITFLSKLFTGSVSDKELVEKSGFLKLKFEPGDSVMADKGFKIQDLLSAKGVALNIPPFLRRQHLTEEEVRQTEEIASLRIHVERRIQRIKAFHIFDRPIPLSIAPIINEIWALCAFLSNLQSPLIAT
ncbi:uncharacterized protein LOC125946467 [Dermacentor silvarum]|uniref:uncharacterized protein LOC125946467 n=1 Tax=Dermacentor silvarum TaxID=543639 RepID=UPI002101699E|nr:uncharacterized protein LOC125946467 [Dermacentor silvarum]